MASPSNPNDRLFNPHGFKHFRRTYSWRELYWGFVVGLVLLAIGGWVAYKGAHPDPELWNDQAALIKKPRPRVVTGSSQQKDSAPTVQLRHSAPPQRRIATEADRLLPDALADEGWQKKSTSQFDANNLYEKINGRAGYFQSFGVKMLYFSTLQHKTQSSIIIDIEMYDMGHANNALGAYAGELDARSHPVVGADGMYHLRRNALFISRGRYYLRLIGSDENATVRQKLESLRKFFYQHLQGTPLPWAYGLFVSRLSVKASAISYKRENAFSFDFGKDVYTAQIGENTYVFISAQQDAKSAQTLSGRYREGFLSYGESEKSADGIEWVKDRYISTYATAVAVERWVIGVQGATTRKLAEDWLQRLRKAVETMPQALRDRAQPELQTQASPPVVPAKESPSTEQPPETRTTPTPKNKQPSGYEKAPPSRRLAPEEESNTPRRNPMNRRTLSKTRHSPTSRPQDLRKPSYEGGNHEK